MESDKIKELQNALCDIRKAHRLIYAYQKSLIALMNFIKTKLGISWLAWHKLYSLYPKNGSGIFQETWAWDFLPTYQMEYQFAEKIIGNYKISLSIVQISDTGFYDKMAPSQTDISEYATEEDSCSKLLFYLNKVSKDSKIDWQDRYKRFEDAKYLVKDFQYEVTSDSNGGTVIMYAVPLEQFTDEDSTLNALQEFIDYCNKNADMNLKLL